MGEEKFVFSFEDYREYLKHRLETSDRGARSALAKAIVCPVSHISQVLNGVSHLSLEQGELTNNYLGHSEEESDYFLLLIQFTRAGSPPLRQRLEKQMKRALEKRLNFQNRIDVQTKITEQDQSKFYSSWHYQALHILATIPKYQTKKSMIQRLGISEKKISEVLEFLISIGLVRFVKDHYETTQQRIHLGSDSPLITKHHLNWRIKTIQTLEQENIDNSLHYSSVISVSEKDIVQIKEKIITNVSDIKKIVKDSPEEEIYCFSVDCYKL